VIGARDEILGAAFATIDPAPAQSAHEVPMSPRRTFRVLVRERGGSQNGRVVDVQLQVRRTGARVWAQTFSDHEQARALEEQLERDLDALDDEAFRRAHRVASDL
jgi:hypothetical protein